MITCDPWWSSRWRYSCSPIGARITWSSRIQLFPTNSQPGYQVGSDSLAKSFKLAANAKVHKCMQAVHYTLHTVYRAQCTVRNVHSAQCNVHPDELPINCTFDTPPPPPPPTCQSVNRPPWSCNQLFSQQFLQMQINFDFGSELPFGGWGLEGATAHCNNGLTGRLQMGCHFKWLVNGKLANGKWQKANTKYQIAKANSKSK